MNMSNLANTELSHALIDARLAETTLVNAEQYLTFIVNAKMYAVNILDIKEIIEYGQITKVPRMPSFIRGVINLRGSVVPVIDLSARFGHTGADITRKSCVVIVEVEYNNEEHVLGILVDAVNAVLDIEQSQIEHAPSFGASIRNDFIYGMGKVNRNFVTILNVSHVLSMDEMAALASTNQH